MDELQQIKEKLNVVDVISEYLPLKKAGINFKTNCPFHEEHTPSFMVSPERGIWHCFGCDKGGDIFKFIMEKEGIEFPEALEILAQKAGIVLQKRKKTDQKNSTDKLFELNLKAAKFYSYLLLENKVGQKALDYLLKRGLSLETIKLFNLGYAPQNWEILSRFLKKRGYTNQEIITSGLAVTSSSGCYDRFRSRIMFPLTDPRDRILGFSGRILGAGEPKYVNTPQTPIFDKGKLLFGLQLSKGEIRQKKEAILVEGEMDMLMSFQSGVKNIIATKGTALTQFQIEALKKYTDTISLCFDADLAGDGASRRGIELADKAGLNIKVISVKDAKDPAELCLQDPKKWKQAVKDAMPIYDYYLESISKRYNIKSASDKRQIFFEIIPIWAKITDPIIKDHYIQKLSALLQIKEELISSQINKLQKENTTPKLSPFSPKTVQSPQKNQLTPPKPHLTSDRRKLLEDYLLTLLLHIPEDITFVPNFPETLFQQEQLKQTYVMLVLFLDTISFKGKSFKINDFINTLPEELITIVDKLFLTQIDDKLKDSKLWQKEVDLAISELKKMLIKSSLEKLSLQIKSAQEFEKSDQLDILNKRFRDLSVKLKNL